MIAGPGKDSEQRRHERWSTIQREIAECLECTQRWPNDVINPLERGQIPEPPPAIDILFVGVAPTAQKGRNKGAHFYSSSKDPLRMGLFKLLGRSEFGLNLDGLSLGEGNKAFHQARCFFVHAAKVRPTADPAPPPEAIAFCATRHLRHEILLLRPKAVCFLGLNNASFAATALFGQDLCGSVGEVVLENWRGLGAVADQPRRGWAERTAVIVKKLWHKTRGARRAGADGGG